jgi:ABC-type branched-subunit amino acid transport system substrate-binding protein
MFLAFASKIRASALLAAVAFVALSAPSQSDPPDAQEQRGRQIYLTGASSSNTQIEAQLGEDGIEVPASTLACINCHGADGRGKPEGGVRPSNITWDALTKPYGVALSSGRKHPPYSESALKRAITMGFDPAGNRLQAAMPRYRMSQQDIADLVAYLKKLGKPAEPGLTETSIQIGTLLPPATDKLSETGGAVRRALEGYFAEVNKVGGVYGRRVELNFIESADSPERSASAVRAFIEQKQPFALTASFIAGADREIASVVDQQQVPLVGAFTLYPQAGSPINRYVFYIHAGIREQVSALAAFVGRKHAQTKWVGVIHAGDKLSSGPVEAIRNSGRQLGWKTIDEIPARGAALTEAVRSQKLLGIEVLFILGAGADRAILDEARRLDWKPVVLIPGALASSELFEAAEGFDQKLFISLPALPSDQTPEGLALYRKLAADHQLPSEHLASQYTAVSSAMLLVEGLKRAGRDVTREKLILALEGLYQYRTGLSPAITFGPNRRLGSMGTHVVAVDPKHRNLIPPGEWIEVK